MTTDLVVVGAGPAGMTAALTAAEYGLSVVVIDEQRLPGGQIFRRPPPEFGDATWTPPTGYRWAADLITRAEQTNGIDWRFQTTALGLLHEERHDNGVVLATYGTRGTEVLRTRRLLIATGAFDMPVPVPGWTLPGVMMAGAVQTLLKSQKILVADRIVLAGSHPLLLVVADLLRKAGADIAEVAFARGLPSLREAIGSIGAVPKHLALLADSAHALGRLRAAGTRISTRTLATNAHGDNRVSAVELTEVDRQWRPSGSTRRVATDALVLGYGFQPSTELARQARCSMRWDSPAGGWVVHHDDTMATDVPGVYVAGEPAGINGAEVARNQGRLAGLSIVSNLTGRNLAAQQRAAEASLRSSRRFSTVVQQMFAPNRAALLDLAHESTILCRCELVSRGQTERTLRINPEMSTANAVKLECRTGMGPCQGRYCETSVSCLVARRRGRPVEQVGYFTAHLPIKPIPTSALTWLDAE